MYIVCYNTYIISTRQQFSEIQVLMDASIDGSIVDDMTYSRMTRATPTRIYKMHSYFKNACFLS